MDNIVQVHHSRLPKEQRLQAQCVRTGQGDVVRLNRRFPMDRG